MIASAFSVALAAFLALVTPAPLATPAPTYTPSPQRLLGLIRAKFRSHRPPPPYIIYTMTRKQNTDRGFPDYAESYTYHIWVRNLDRAALGRKVLIAPAMGFPEFMRPAFNEDRDPGPPTADLFEPAPPKPRPVTEVPTPEPLATQYKQIGSVTVTGEYDYYVDKVAVEGNLDHLTLRPIRDPERNRLREVYVDKDSLELVRLITHDRLFDEGANKIYSALFDIKIAMLQGVPIVTAIHGIVGDGYDGDGKVVDYTYTDITFPATLPAWYFDARSYAQHEAELPL
ncbi:MAG: hypothetical protein ABSB70_21695 [Candidatus Velthaea sp.]|jgi:hypothetical protein